MLVRPLLALLVLALTACSALPSRTPPTPTPEPVPPEVRVLPGRGVEVDGHGSAMTDEITPDYSGGLSIGIEVVTLTHDGHSSFIVNAMQGNQSENVTSAVGAYQGQRPLVVEDAVSFQVTADGNWTLKVQPMSSGGTPAFRGTGDSVSPYFQPPDAGVWNVSFDGQARFFVYAHCVGGSVVVEDKTGAFNESINMQFSRGPCFWEVRADGNFSLSPQS